ncbi:hypothetical protein [Sebaldella termitidis]|uniref:hypothetical protein n=1 Tax=Sebaldella termitidis TaxID=826 RepID=UPI003EBDF92E
MGIFKKFFSKIKISDSETDFAASELKREKEADFQKENSNSQEFFSNDSDNISRETINELLGPVIDVLGDITSDKYVHNVKLTEDDIKKIYAKYTKTVITKDGKQIYESVSDVDSETTEFVNELFDKIFNKK